MAGQAIEPLFNQMYDETSQKVLIYITSKCGNPSDIQDIFQETYTELFFILKKGEANMSKTRRPLPCKLQNKRSTGTIPCCKS